MQDKNAHTCYLHLCRAWIPYSAGARAGLGALVIFVCVVELNFKRQVGVSRGKSVMLTFSLDSYLNTAFLAFLVEIDRRSNLVLSSFHVLYYEIPTF